MYGLLKRDLMYITKAIEKHAEIEEVILFGSRAMGNYKQGSDIDLAVKGAHVNLNIIRRLLDDLNEVYPLPYFFDIVNYDDIVNQELKNHIDAAGKTIYTKVKK